MEKIRELLISDECLAFIGKLNIRGKKKFEFLLEVLTEQQVVPKNFVEKLTNTDYYELKIKVDNQIRIILFTIDSRSFNNCKKAILLNGIVKKSNKDYIKAVKTADKLLKKYKDEV